MNVAFIPVRGGSKSIPLKNIKILNGKPLVYWTAKAANDSLYVDEVVISTDSNIIKDVVNSFGLPKVIAVDRSPETASDTATTESAMLEYARNNKTFENIILIQATSPLLNTEDIDKGFELFYKSNCDSVFSGVRKKQFLWYDDEGYAEPTYDPLNRPRRQDYKGYIVENGAFYITSRKRLIESECRISGRIAVCEMDEKSVFEIDEPDDWRIIEAIMKEYDSTR